VIDTTAIPPGGEGHIAVTLDTHGKRGKMNKPINITTDSPQTRELTINVEADVELDFDFETPNLYLGQIAADSVVVKNVFVFIKDVDEFKLGEITVTSPLLSARSLGIIQEEGQPARLEIEVTAGPGFPPDQFKGTVLVHSNLKRKPVTELLVWAQIPTGVEIAPRSLNFRIRGSVPADLQQEKLVNITNYANNLPLEILEVRDLDGNTKLTLKTVRASREYQLVVALDNPSVPTGGHRSGRIMVRTNNPQYKEVTVAYSMVWQQ
jgi:hypothetical protein